MLTFLRKIRRSLIESGSARKYILYAIGEIALVVLGILIALQINNWNAHNIQVKNLKSDLSSVTEDIDNNQTQLGQLKEVRRRALHSCSEIIDLYKNSGSMALSQFIQGYGPIVIEQKFKPNFRGIERVKSSQIFESLSLVAIRKLIREYEDLIENNHYTESKLNDHIETMETDLFGNGFYDGVWNFLRSEFIDPEKYESPSEDPDIIAEMKHTGTLVGIFLRFEIECPIIMAEYDGIVAKGEELKAAIEKYIAQ
ncbi:MAG: hypothetical protein KJP00_16945 [Bacteroidia bacterium]|nr:hypothetical protein [Bacteroidia bacterium]